MAIAASARHNNLAISVLDMIIERSKFGQKHKKPQMFLDAGLYVAAHL